jgi:hypothetical protein
MLSSKPTGETRRVDAAVAAAFGVSAAKIFPFPGNMR